MTELAKINFFILDLDGTIYLENKLLKGSLDFLNKLKKQQKDFVFLTNNSSKNRADYQQKLAELGIDVSPEKIINSGEITAAHLTTKNAKINSNKNKQGKRIFLLGTESLKLEMERFGHTIVNQEKNLRQKAATVDYVVLGFDKSLTYQKLWLAHDLILAGVDYVATHPDLVCPLKGGRTQPDCGAMIELLAASTGKRPQIIGKPAQTTVNYIVERFQLKKSELAMVGDRLYTDMKMAKEAGITGILVLSGETSAADLKQLNQQNSAANYHDYLFKDVAELSNSI
ncbi:HAD-IIA family hydrolase [Halanaerobium salsuginis]|uniref:Acid sugar phosphatase n=1 Tax=Halanaerobium salsuginis TaxID=29563 RepID=A0A1I4FPK9_9FIRM|nr:HAD-IIA family hydrolase [Halanaerobium salsuginis]SFL19794.1 NagD protein [Halanaerobium salsuginis]